jgi:mono/diheme cytochrome c family protein
MIATAEVCVRATALLVLAGASFACGRGGDRDTETVDSAVLHAAAGIDSANVYTVRPPPDSAVTDPPLPPIIFPEPASILVADSVAGQRLYRTVGGCIACHGGRGEGIPGLGSSLTDTIWQRGNGSLSLLYSTTRDGIAGSGDSRTMMPGTAGRLSPGEIFRIAAWVYTLSHPGVTVRDSLSLPAGAPSLARPPADTTRLDPLDGLTAASPDSAIRVRGERATRRRSS